jgi:hypothetical protein
LLPKSFKRKISVVCKFSPKSPVKVWNTIKINVHRKAKSHSLLVAFLGHPFLPCPLQSANLTFPPYVGFHFGIKNLAVLTMFLQPHFNEINCLRPFPHFFFWFFFFFFQYWNLNSGSWCLLHRHSATWATPSALFALVIFQIGFCVFALGWPGQRSFYKRPPAAGTTGVYCHSWLIG